MGECASTRWRWRGRRAAAVHRWVIGFRGAIPGATPWWARWLRRGYVHCWAARRLWSGAWLWVEWTPERLVVGVCTPDLVRRAAAGADRVLLYRAADGAARRVSLPQPGFIHCAQLVAQAVGVRLWWPTPYGLACALTARGARLLLVRGGA
jgi:hypothetical protein